MTQQEIAEEIEEGFALFEDWEERYRFLIDLGRELPPLTETELRDENLIPGCQSRVWIAVRNAPQSTSEALEFGADSDSAIVKGLVSILWRLYSGQTAQNILNFDIAGLLSQLDLEEHLSMNRRNGLYSMIQRIKELASQAIHATRSNTP
jgi:cysteine desulfuration protein SufE